MNKLSKAVGRSKKGATINLSVKADAKLSIFPSGYNKWRKSIEIDVDAPAKDNKANIRIIKTLSDFFDVPNKDVYIVSGKQNKEKKVLIKGYTQTKVINRIEESMDGL